MPLIVAGTDSMTLPVGTTAQRNATPVTGMVRFNSTTGVQEYYNGTNWLTSGIVSATAQNSTAGTTLTFGSIPAGVKRITVMFNGVSTSGTNNIQVRLGTASGIEATGYTGTVSDTSSGVGSTVYAGAGFDVTRGSAAANLHQGSLIITNLSGNIWTAFGIVGYSAGGTYHTGGTKTLGGTLTQLVITSVGSTDTFDAGSVNIMYE